MAEAACSPVVVVTTSAEGVAGEGAASVVVTVSHASPVVVAATGRSTGVLKQGYLVKKVNQLTS